MAGDPAMHGWLGRRIFRRALAPVVVAAAVLAAMPGAGAAEELKYPDLKGQWTRVEVGGQPPFDPTRPRGLGQQAPLTPQYEAIFEANLADKAAGGQGTSMTFACLPDGMPQAMNAYEPIEFIVTPDTTYILIEHIEHNRRIYTDGRDWPTDALPAFGGYSIGQWIDRDGDGRYDELDVETRNFKGPRAYDASGLPLHDDNQSVIKERIYLDQADRNVLHDEITVIDHALTRPWAVTKNYKRNPSPRPVWREYICAENNPHVLIGKQIYYLSAEGFLMPAKKDQPPPDLRYFKKPQP